MTVHITNRFGSPLTPFRTIAELRDSVSTAWLPAPEIVKTWSPGEQVEHELLVEFHRSGTKRANVRLRPLRHQQR